MIKTLSLNHEDKTFANMNDKVKNPNQLIKTLSLNHKNKSFANMNDEVKNPNQVRLLV